MFGQFFRSASAALVFLATVAGAYFGAAALHLEWAFWVLVALALIFALCRMAGPSMVGWVRAKREQLKNGADYARLLQVAGDRTAEVERLEGLLTQADLDAELGFASGLTEGRRRLIAEWIAGATSTSLRPAALYVPEDDPQVIKVTAMYEDEPPHIGSHWQARVLGNPAVRAVFVVESVEISRHHAVLVLAYARDEQIVQMLEASAAKTSEFPVSIELERRAFATIEDLAEEG